MGENNIIGCLRDRQLIEIGGDEAATFLQALVTTDIKALIDGMMMAGALLSPQGKLLFDFLVTRAQDKFIIDAPCALAEAFIKRLSLYKLRSKVEIVSLEPMVVLISHVAQRPQAKFCFQDGRFGDVAPIKRFYLPFDAPNQPDRQEWDRLRIAHALAESGTDFAPSDVFAHDINLDQIGGVSFKKGCYIGQEVVSRMQYRGTARRRLLQVAAQEPLPPCGTEIAAAGKPVGVMGGSVEMQGLAQGLAIVRLDRVKLALDKGQKITTNGIDVSLTIPETVNFSYPETQAEA